MRRTTGINVRELLDVDTSSLSFTCVGITQKGARCRNMVAAATLTEANCVLREIDQCIRHGNVDPKSLVATLDRLAESTLCLRWHRYRQSQIEPTADRWYAMIQRTIGLGLSAQSARNQTSRPLLSNFPRRATSAALPVANPSSSRALALFTPPSTPQRHNQVTRSSHYSASSTGHNTTPSNFTRTPPSLSSRAITSGVQSQSSQSTTLSLALTITHHHHTTTAPAPISPASPLSPTESIATVTTAVPSFSDSGYSSATSNAPSQTDSESTLAFPDPATILPSPPSSIWSFDPSTPTVSEPSSSASSSRAATPPPRAPSSGQLTPPLSPSPPPPSGNSRNVTADRLASAIVGALVPVIKEHVATALEASTGTPSVDALLAALGRALAAPAPVSLPMVQQASTSAA